eukprot:985198-Rhodomonas_salina.1
MFAPVGAQYGVLDALVGAPYARSVPEIALQARRVIAEFTCRLRTSHSRSSPFKHPDTCPSKTVGCQIEPPVLEFPSLDDHHAICPLLPQKPKLSPLPSAPLLCKPTQVAYQPGSQRETGRAT